MTVEKHADHPNPHPIEMPTFSTISVLKVGRLGLEKQLIDKEETFDGLIQIVKEKDEILNSENLATLKAEVERLRRELSKEHMTLEQERGLVEQKNVVIQTLEDDKKRLLAERDEVLQKAGQEVRMNCRCSPMCVL